MVIHIRDESTPSPNLSNGNSSSLKVYRVDEFVDTRFATTFFLDERKRWNALRQRRREYSSDSPDDAQRFSKRGGWRSPKEVALLAKL